RAGQRAVALGDVEDHGADGDDRAVLEDRVVGGLESARVARVAARELDARRRAAGPQDLAQHWADALGHLGRDDLVDTAADVLLRRQPVDGRQRRVDVRVAQLRVDYGHADGRAVGCRIEERLWLRSVRHVRRIPASWGPSLPTDQSFRGG